MPALHPPAHLNIRTPLGSGSPRGSARPRTPRLLDGPHTPLPASFRHAPAASAASAASASACGGSGGPFSSQPHLDAAFLLSLREGDAVEYVSARAAAPGQWARGAVHLLHTDADALGEQSSHSIGRGGFPTLPLLTAVGVRALGGAGEVEVVGPAHVRRPRPGPDELATS